MAIELVTYADLKALLGLEDALITDYPALNLLRTSVTYAIEEYLGRELESKERSEIIYITSPTKMLRLDAIPVSIISSLDVTIADDTETYASDDYYITSYGLRFYHSISNATVEITYTGGISTVPNAMSRAALMQTAYEFQAKEQIGAESVSTEGGFVSRPELGLLKETRRMLNNYIHPLNW